MSDIDKKQRAFRAKDLILWGLALLLLIAGVVLNYQYQLVDIYLRIIAWIVGIGFLIAIVFFTSQGQKAWKFATVARMELYKVVWPNRQDTVRMTLVVIGLVILLSLIIWGLDTFLYWFIGLLIGQRG